MKPLQVYLSNEDFKALAGWAKAHRTTKSEVIRDAVRALLRSQETDPFLALAGAFPGRPGSAADLERELGL